MIGIFDSGLGGLSVLELALQTPKLKNESFLYYADRNHVPYGTRPKEQIISYSINSVEFLIQKGAKAVIVACNTATSAAIKPLREQFDIPIIGMEPAIKPALNNTKSKALLLATPVTIAGEKLDSLISSTNNAKNLIKIALPKLVEFAEIGDFTSQSLKEYLSSQLDIVKDENIDSVVLGCTHFNYFKDEILNILKGVKFYDGNQGTINRLLSQIYVDTTKSYDKKVRYFYSSKEIKDGLELDKIKNLLNRLNLMSVIS